MLHKEAVEQGTLELLKSLQQDAMLKDFWLVGGTALALQMGHRLSHDLDLFTQQDFDSHQLLEYLESRYHFILNYSSGNTLKGAIVKVNLDFIAHKYPLSGKPLTTEGIRLLPTEDIAAMKLNAIAGDGTRAKDFIDIYFILKQFSLNQILDFYAIKYTKRNQFHALKSLTWFNDIDETVWPKMILEPDLNLSKIKAVLVKQVKTFSSNLAGEQGPH
jgi:hypothetical protein